jgi:hypothetical protein
VLQGFRRGRLPDSTSIRSSNILIPATVDFDGKEAVGKGIMVGKVLADVKKDCCIPVRIMNLDDRTHTIRKGSAVANCEIIDDMDNILPSSASSSMVGGEILPEAVKSLYERSAVCLDSEQKTEVYKLLLRNVDVFSTGPDDLGQTDKVQHRIETGDAPPVK